MSVTIFHITTNGGTDFTGQSRDILAEQLRAFRPGRHKIAFEKVGAAERPTRYKWYFSVMMTEILNKCADLTPNPKATVQANQPTANNNITMIDDVQIRSR